MIEDAGVVKVGTTVQPKIRAVEKSSGIRFYVSPASVSWSSSNESVLSFDANGNMVAKATGTVVITATFSTGSTLQSSVTVKGSLPFEDVSENDWYYTYVEFAYKNGLMTGMDPVTFSPLGSVSRAQFAVMLWRQEGEPATAYSDIFTDVADGTWYTPAVMWASESGVITGYNDGSFGPADTITREQIVTMLYRYAQHKGYDTTTQDTLERFIDVDHMSDFAYDGMAWAVGTGVITGKYSGDCLSPLENTTRAECATMLQRFVVGLHN